MAYKFFIYEENQEKRTAVIKINRPEALNALNRDLLTELSVLIADINANKSLRSVIFTGEGKAFIAGADIAEMSLMTQNEGERFAQYGQDVFRELEQLPLVSIAAINGFALGGGLEFALACDIRIASVKARLGQPEVSLGLIPGFGATQRLARVVGMGWAKHLILTGEQIDGAKAASIGLISEVCEPEVLLERALAIAGQIAAKGPVSLHAAKQAVESAFHLPFDQGFAHEAGLFGKLFPAQAGNTANEVVEGTTAFLAKRKADFTNRP